jgi:hypothetical protein
MQQRLMEHKNGIRDNEYRLWNAFIYLLFWSQRQRNLAHIAKDQKLNFSVEQYVLHERCKYDFTLNH